MTNNGERKEQQITNIGFCASWADGIIMSICNSIQLLFLLDGIKFEKEMFNLKIYTRIFATYLNNNQPHEL